MPSIASPSLPYLLLTAAVGLLAAALGYVAGRARSTERESRLREQLARAESQTRTDAQLVEAVRSVSATTMAEQSEQLLRLGESRNAQLEQLSRAHWREQGDAVVGRLGEYAERLARLEQQRQGESAVLRQAMDELRRTNEEVRTEARGLASAMRDNTIRGAWGEMQLRRVLEQSGMEPHADFLEQRGVRGGSLRPDVVVRLPNDRCVVIDAKAPLDAFLRAAACDDDVERTRLLVEHARSVAGHVAALARRRYDDAVPGSVDFVVMFIPGDGYLSSAFEHRPGLFEEAAAQDVILASPSTLLAFLRGMATGWRERVVADEAEAIAALGRELHERVAIFAEHFVGVGTALGRAVGSYNQAVGSMESRLLVTARRFEHHAAGSRRAIPSVEGVDELPVAPSATELSA